MKILITGGHLTPALAVIEALPKDVEVVYVGRKYALEGDKAESLEYTTITQRGIQFIELHTGRLQRTFTRKSFPSLLRLPGGFSKAWRIVKQTKPDVIVAFGSYVATPICIAGYFQKIPILIHEQTLDAGLTNKLLAKFATTICISYSSSQKYFPKNRTVLTGNPVLSELKIAKDKKLKTKSQYPHLVIVGGSLGSHAINLLVEQSLEQLLKKYSIFHQTGDAKEFGDFDRLTKLKDSLPTDLQKRYIITRFVDPTDIAATLAEADLVVTRAGMNTIATLLVLNKPALVIPLPVSQHNEQYKNAVFLQEHMLAEVANQQLLTPELFVEKIDSMIQRIHAYKNTKDQAEILIHQQAAKRIVSLIVQLGQHR